MKQKLTIAVLFGGMSAEHDISLISAANIIKNIPPDQYIILPVAIDRKGGWWTGADYNSLVQDGNKVPKLVLDQATALFIKPGQPHPVYKHGDDNPIRVDVFFSILHGPIGEDGSMQGLFRILGIPFVGPDLTGSAVAMDKDLMKRLFKQARILTSDWLTFHHWQKNKINKTEIINKLGLPLYVKPANMGSSIGISRVEKESQLDDAINEAFLYDRKILLEKSIQGREIEVAVLGNHDPVASTVGEIVPKDGWYSYQSKYFDEKGAVLHIPATVEHDIEDKIRSTALQAYKALGLEGLSRVDLFLTNENEIYLNEANTLPGFTSISMYPKLFEKSGLPQNELMHRLIELAIERFNEIKNLKTIADIGSD